MVVAAFAIQSARDASYDDWLCIAAVDRFE